MALKNFKKNKKESLKSFIDFQAFFRFGLKTNYTNYDE